MPWMTFCGIPAPVDNEVRAVLDFTEGAGDFASQLGGDFSGTVSQRGVTVEQSPKIIGHRHALALRFASGIAHAINQRHVGVVQV